MIIIMSCICLCTNKLYASEIIDTEDDREVMMICKVISTSINKNYLYWSMPTSYKYFKITITNTGRADMMVEVKGKKFYTKRTISPNGTIDILGTEESGALQTIVFKSSKGKVKGNIDITAAQTPI